MGGGGGVGRGVGGWGGGRREFLVGGVLLARDADLKSLVVVLFAEVSFFRSFEGIGRLNVIRDGCQKGEDSGQCPQTTTFFEEKGEPKPRYRT